MLLVQEYLKSGKTLEELKTEHGVCSNITNDKLCLTYHMIKAEETNLLACQCRGLVLDSKTYDVIAYPMNRFFNLSQEHLIPKDFDWKSVKYYDKLDGSLCIVYYHLDRWYCGTRSLSEADVPIKDKITFSILFDMAINDMNYRAKSIESNVNGSLTLQDFMKDFGEKAKGYTFCFEIVSLYNRVYCDYNKNSVSLLMVRNNTTLVEEEPELWLTNEIVSNYKLDTSEKFQFDSIQHMIAIVNSWNPKEHEGVVAVDKSFNRIKVKNSTYLMLCKVNAYTPTYTNYIELVLLGKDDDIKDDSEMLTKTKSVLRELYRLVEQDFNTIKHIENVKEFSKSARKTLWPAAMYELKKNKYEDLHSFVIDKLNSTKKNFIYKLCQKVDSTLE